MKKYSIS